MRGYEGETQRLEPPCTQCGGTTFTWGRVAAQHYTKFLPDVPAESFVEKLLGTSPYEILTRMCDTCHNIQMFGIK